MRSRCGSLARIGLPGPGVLPGDHDLVAPAFIVGSPHCRLHEGQRAHVREIVPGQSHQHRIVHGRRSCRQIHDTGVVRGQLLERVRHSSARAGCAGIRHRGRIVEGREADDVFEEQGRPVEPLCGACGLVPCERSVERSRSVSSKDRPKLISRMMLSESTGAQGRNVVISRTHRVLGGNEWRAT